MVYHIMATVQGNFNPHMAITSRPPSRPPPLTRQRRLTREAAETLRIEIQEYEKTQGLLQNIRDALGRSIVSHTSRTPTLKTLALRQLSTDDIAYARCNVCFDATQREKRKI